MSCANTTSTKHTGCTIDINQCSEPPEASSSATCRQSPSHASLRLVRCTEEDLNNRERHQVFQEVKQQTGAETMRNAALNVLNHVVAELCSSYNLAPLKYKVVRDIGQGTFGTISLCVREGDTESKVGKHWDQRLVLKTSLRERSQYDKEKRVLFLLRQGPSFITHCLGCFQSGQLDIIALPFFAGGDLYTHLSARWPLPFKDIALYAGEIASALHYMHQKDIIYLDLKAENVLLSHTGHMRIIDFGISVIMDDSHEVPSLGRKQLVTEAGTLPYCAPEILRRIPHAFESDWWSMGILLYEMVVGYTPFLTSDDPQDICQSICGLPFEIPEEMYDDHKLAFDLITKLLVKDQKKRLGYEITDFEDRFKKHSFFAEAGIDWELLAKEQIEPEWTPELHDSVDTRYFDY